jgi:hypothetical protein
MVVVDRERGWSRQGQGRVASRCADGVGTPSRARARARGADGVGEAWTGVSQTPPERGQIWGPEGVKFGGPERVKFGVRKGSNLGSQKGLFWTPSGRGSGGGQKTGANTGVPNSY